MTDTDGRPAAQVITCPTCGSTNRVPNAARGKPTCARCHNPLPWLVAAGDADFDRVAVDSDLPVLVDLWAPWCGPCHMLAPHVEKAAQTFAGRLKVVKVNVDEAPRVAERFGVRGVPTLLVLDHGGPVARQVGALPGSQLERWIEGALVQSAAGRS
ncbi:MAG TPA: thioredoxin [Candidatus Dormibacteraeota bacterium]|jgi:thioredoxin 2